jgi:hypothetical protein
MPTQYATKETPMTQTLALTIKKVATLDGEAKRAVRRIEIALANVQPVGTSEMLPVEDLNLLRGRLSFLTRQNLCLQYQVSNPTFSLRESVEDFAFNINDGLQTGTAALSDIKSVYNLRFFAVMYHPGYILRVCNILADTFESRKVEPSQLWKDLIVSEGVITQEILDTFDISKITDEQI